MKIFFLLLVLVMGSIKLQAQEVILTLKTINKNNEPIASSTVTLKSLVDSSLKETKVTNNEGKVNFKVAKNNKYIVQISNVGFATVNKAIAIAEADISINYVLKQKVQNNGAVTVTAKKPLITQEDDKTIVDPENLAQTSTNAFEVLEKTPGIFADQDGNFYLSSTTPATVQINGRDMRLGANDLATLLKTLPPNSILKIEIVRTPSAKNDATGSGGVINIVLKKGVKLGMAGSIFGGINQGVYGNQFIGASISNNSDKKTKYAYTGFVKRASYDALKSNRNLSLDTLLQQNSRTQNGGWNPYLNFGASYLPNKKWDLGYDANISYNKADNNSTNTNGISKLSANNTFVNNVNDATNDGGTTNISQTVSAKLKADSNKIEWSSSVNYNFFKYDNKQNYTTNYTLPSTFITKGNGTQNSTRHLITLQTDLIWKPIKKLTFEIGAKTAWLNYTNATAFYKNNVTDNNRTNKFKYKENISAAYIQTAKTIEKFVIKAGLRMEYTQMDGTQEIPTVQKFTIKRTDFFPYVYLSRPIVTIMKYDLKAYLVYRKSIARPGYDLLNPFSKFVDNYLSEVGNPNLKPQFTETYEANLSFEDQPILAFGQNKTKGLFTNVIYQNPNNPSEILRTYDNLGANTEKYFRFTAAIPPGGKYFVVVGGQRNFNTYDGLYENKPLKFSNTSWNFFTYHQLKIDNRTNLFLQGWMQTGGLYQFYQLSNFGQAGIGGNRQFLNKKLIVTINIRDVFFTNKNDFKILQGSVNAYGNRQTDSRRFGINIRYNFGIKKKEEQPSNYNGNENSTAN
jgi:iron complex outermembrane recepter protein